jgi:antitoxin ParD1/3/4/toxin ParE1/3/4
MSDNFILTPDAQGDALAIWEHIADDDSVEAADRVVARIFDACENLAKMPGIGHHRENLLDQRNRFWSVWSYLIVYRWQVIPIQVIAIVHGARDLDAFFGGRPS